MSHPTPIVSVVIPTRNGGNDLRRLIVSLCSQDYPEPLEIFVMDSESTDGSAEQAAALGAHVVQVSPDDFSHSGTRNLGAERCSGDLLLFMVQDALPTGPRWLSRIVGKLHEHSLAALSCCEYPRSDVDLYYLATCRNHYRYLGVDREDRIIQPKASAAGSPLEDNGQLSNIACMIHRSTFERHRFRGRYAEDIDLSLRLLKAGEKIALLAAPKVIHSHNRHPYYYLRRGYVSSGATITHFGQPPPPEATVDEFVAEVLWSAKQLTTVRETILADSGQTHLLSRFAQWHQDSLRGEFAAAAPEVSVSFASSETADQGWAAYLNRLEASVSRVEPGKSLTFITALAAFLSMIFDNLGESYPTVDGSQRKDVVTCVEKAFANCVGYWLARYEASQEQRSAIEPFVVGLSDGV